jgi:hypothetical protein
MAFIGWDGWMLTNEQQHQLFTSAGVIDAISGHMVYAQFPNGD